MKRRVTEHEQLLARIREVQSSTAANRVHLSGGQNAVAEAEAEVRGARSAHQNQTNSLEEIQEAVRGREAEVSAGGARREGGNYVREEGRTDRVERHILEPHL